MTQLIAAICDGGKAVVTVSDRMVSTGDMTLTFEQEQPKADLITANAIVLTAGTMHEPDLIRDARQKAKGKERIREIADVLKTLYQDLRVEHIEDEVLKPLAGLDSFAEYHEKQKTLHDSVVIDLNDKIKRYSLDLSLLLAGVDEQGHIIEIANPGIWRSSDSVGYCTIGMGDRHADNIFAWYRYSIDVPLQEALYIAFEAKKKAEMAGGVGAITDLCVIDKQACKAVKSQTVEQLGEIYNEREQRQKKGAFNRNIPELKIQTEALKTS